MGWQKAVEEMVGQEEGGHLPREQDRLLPVANIARRARAATHCIACINPAQRV